MVSVVSSLLLPLVRPRVAAGCRFVFHHAFRGESHVEWSCYDRTRPLRSCVGWRTAALRTVTSTATRSRKSPHDSHKEDPAIDRLFRMNREWVQRTNETNPDFFTKLGRGQAPDYLYIGCSDSRVAVNDLMGIEMGELFVHRNIANMVVSSDLNMLAVLTYAVEHLKVKHILVTGHYDCGGIRAAVQKQDQGQILDAWLQSIRDVYRLHKRELDRIPDDEARHRRLVELNVCEQCLNLYKTPVVQRRRLETYNDGNELQTMPRIHGLVFDPATGILSKVPIDFRREISALRDTYDLFDAEEYEASYLLKRQTLDQVDDKVEP